MKRILFICGWIVLLVTACTTQYITPVNVEKALSYCDVQVHRSLADLRVSDSIDYTMQPRNILSGERRWNCRKVDKTEWTGGFWPGVLWYDYEATGNDTIRREAEKFTETLNLFSKMPAYDHDLGFLVFCSFGNGYRITHNEAYKRVILAVADSLATLYNPHVGTILSWPRNVGTLGGHNTIMDNMINLEMLFWAARNGGTKNLYDIAVSHADKTMENQFRSDYTSYHVAVYDSLSGKCIRRCTHQGYSDGSMWARGQAWAIYGFTMVYRETRGAKYLDFAKKVADAYLKRLPEDCIPYWDFDDPNIPSAPRDASAACVVASALIELSSFCEGKDKVYYLSMAEKMLNSLFSSAYSSGNVADSFLLHSTGHWPNKSEVDAAIIYADYYYIEALLRLKKLYGQSSSKK